MKAPIIKVAIDVTETVAALERVLAEILTWETAPTHEEFRAQLDGIPPVKLLVDGQIVDEVWLAV